METWSRSSAFGNVPLKQSSKKNVNLGLLYGNCKLPRAFTHKQNRYNITKTNSACVVSYVLSKMINILYPVPFFRFFSFFFFFFFLFFFFLLFTSCEASLQIFSPQKSIFRSPSMCPNFSYFKVNNENGFELCCSYADFASLPFLLTRSSGSGGLPRLCGEDRVELRSHLRNILLVLLLHHHRLHRRFRRFRRHPFRRENSPEVVAGVAPSDERHAGASSTILTPVGPAKSVHARGRTQADWFCRAT